MNRPPKALVERAFEFFFGPDEDEKIGDAIEADEQLAKSGALPLRKADYTVEVVYDPETQLFGARLKTKTKDMDIDAEGSTPGEALAYVGMLIDASLARKGFSKEKDGR